MDQNAQDMPTVYTWHDEWFDPVLKLFVASRGSMIYVLEGRGGRPLSRGHHRLFFIGKELFGQTGAEKEPVDLSPMMYGAR